MDALSKSEQPLYKVLKDLATQHNPVRYLEIGVQEGDSLRVVLDNTQVRSLVLCDTWGGEYGGTNRKSAEHIRTLLAEYPQIEQRTIISGDSKVEIPKQANTLGEFDLILIDGDHSVLGCLTDMTNCWKHLVVGGHMIVDDLSHPLHKALNHAFLGFVIEKGDACKIEKYELEDHGVGAIRRVK